MKLTYKDHFQSNVKYYQLNSYSGIYVFMYNFIKMINIKVAYIKKIGLIWKHDG